MTDGTLTLIMLLTIFGFITLAVLVLAPVYLFLKREQRAGDEMTREILKERIRKRPPSTNGSPHRDAASEQNQDAP